MPISNDYEFIDPKTILLDRENRQRKVISTEGLKESIEQNGILNPIIIHRDRTLVAGERRLTCALELGLNEVPIRYFDALSPIEAQIVELEENLKRSDLHWRDHVIAVGKIHEAYQSFNSDWSITKTAKNLALNPSYTSMILRVHANLDHPILAQAVGIRAAHNLLERINSRKVDVVLNDLVESGTTALSGLFAETEDTEDAPSPAHDLGAIGQSAAAVRALSPSPTSPVQSPTPNQTPAHGPASPVPLDVTKSILNTSFLDWAPSYRGPKFNFIHCDFPYGKNVFDGSKMLPGGVNSSADMEESVADAQARLYDDRPEVYWDLLKCFCENWENFASHSAHVMFWFSMTYYRETLKFFDQNAPHIDFHPIPLVWMKSDNRGVIADPQRGPRNIYEVALFGRTEDRKIVRPVSNAYASPSDKAVHHSAKPEAMLHHFFGMFVDETTKLLDPTCGGGSALRAAERLRASHVLGLEINEEHCENARQALRKARVLAQA